MGQKETMMPTKVETYFLVYRDDEKGEEQEIEIKIAGLVTPATPAKLTGPPEDCYPAEGGCVEDLEVLRPDGFQLTDDEQTNALDALYDEFERQSDPEYDS